MFLLGLFLLLGVFLLLALLLLLGLYLLGLFLEETNQEETFFLALLGRAPSCFFLMPVCVPADPGLVRLYGGTPRLDTLPKPAGLK